MIQDPKYELKGLKMPNLTKKFSQLFADATLLFLDGSLENLNKVMRIFEIYSKTSGAKINWHKCRAIWASSQARLWTWGEEVGLVWLEPGAYARYLGYPLGYNVNIQEIDNTIVNKIRECIHKWAKKK